MNKLLALFLALSLTAQAGIPSLDASKWACYYCRYPYPTFVNTNDGLEFDFPQIDPKYPEFGYGELHYVLTRFQPPLDFTPKEISMTFRVESSPDVEYVSVQVPEVSARFRMIFMATYLGGCPQTSDPKEIDPNPIPCQYRSWWANTSDSYYILGSKDNQTFTITVPLNPDLWSSVFGRFGHESEGWFDIAKSHIAQVGFTFGGNFFGHGVKLGDGQSTFKLMDYRLEK